MHKILVQTELPRLRSLGYEVYNPPYLSSIEDQSACLTWDENQPTTLPQDVFKKLSQYNFFYNAISHEIAQLLNTYFDAIIVTISPLWLKEILSCYRGKVIYRTYGQHYLVSQELEAYQLVSHIVSRDNFWFVPHSRETAEDEASWLREREVIIPYCLTDDIFLYENQWKENGDKKKEIALTCPNIKNKYFLKHYRFLKENFNASYYKYYGVQLSNIKDNQVVGTLSRKEFISRFLMSAGYLYTYSDRRVCYLPPIEMMILGGPVLYLKGSLLDRYCTEEKPGCCFSIKEAWLKSERLLKGDKTFINDIILSQEKVKKYYSPTQVWPVFDREFRVMLDQNNSASSWLTFGRNSSYKQRKRIYIFHHFPANLIIFNEGEYTACDGIPRVVRQIVRILSSLPDVEVIVTAYADQVANIEGYFRNTPDKERVKVLCINPEAFPEVYAANEAGENIKSKRSILKYKLNYGWGHIKPKIKSFLKRITSPSMRIFIRRNYDKAISQLAKIKNYQHVTNNIPNYIKLINEDSSCLSVFVPHYYWFPDALGLTQRVVLYLPDYMPHFFHATGEFAADEGEHTSVGCALAEKADAIFCNSNFTKSYLPISRLNVSPQKIHVAYLPCLNADKAHAEIDSDKSCDQIINKPFIFYPTRPHPNKNLAFLFLVFDKLVEEGHDLNLVLTTTIEHDPKASKVFHSIKHKDRIKFLSVVSDSLLGQLYRRASLLCFTSLAEGNFPPQIHEALKYGTPIVASKLGFITERIPDDLKNSIILCEANQESDFVEGCKFALANREIVLERQFDLWHMMEKQNIAEAFEKKVKEIFNLI